MRFSGVVWPTGTMKLVLFLLLMDFGILEGREAIIPILLCVCDSYLVSGCDCLLLVCTNFCVLVSWCNCSVWLMVKQFYRFFPASQKKWKQKNEGAAGFSPASWRWTGKPQIFLFNFVLLSPHPSCCMSRCCTRMCSMFKSARVQECCWERSWVLLCSI